MSVVGGAERIAFGLFEVDLHAGEVWRSGHRVKLPAQPFKVLTVLLKKPGEVISRDDLQREVWGSDTNVDFERAVAGAINKIREALGDSAENPRFIQTLPKRGYRFIAPVRVSHPEASIKPEPVHRGALVEEHQTEIVTAASLEAVAPLLLQPAYLKDHEPDAVSRVAAEPGSRTVPLWVALTLCSILACLSASLWWVWRVQAEPVPLKIEQITYRGAISTGPPNVENMLTLATDGNRILTSVMENGRPALCDFAQYG